MFSFKILIFILLGSFCCEILLFLLRLVVNFFGDGFRSLLGNDYFSFLGTFYLCFDIVFLCAFFIFWVSQ